MKNLLKKINTSSFWEFLTNTFTFRVLNQCAAFVFKGPRYQYLLESEFCHFSSCTVNRVTMVTARGIILADCCSHVSESAPTQTDQSKDGLIRLSLQKHKRSRVLFVSTAETIVFPEKKN